MTRHAGRVSRARVSGPALFAAISRRGSERAVAPANHRRGIDLGWLAACAGLVGAAMALGRSAKSSGMRSRAPLALARLRGSHGR